MPEDQNVWAEVWNTRLNRFLETVIGWRQLGRSNNDVWCERIQEKVGLDSVFAYHRNPSSNQQVVLVEAKTRERLDSISKSEIQKWVDRFTVKLENAPLSPEFREKFQPDTNAQFRMGLIGLWVRDSQSYSHPRLQQWLSQLHVAQRRNPLNICFISNQTITRLCAIHDEVNALRSSESYTDVGYYFPSYGDKPSCDGNSLPVEALLSKFIFCQAKRHQRLVGSGGTHSFDSSIVFYLGQLGSYHDLRFIGLALRDFQLLQAGEAAIYTLYEPETLRNEINGFKEEFRDKNVQFEFRQLTTNHELPGWLGQDD